MSIIIIDIIIPTVFVATLSMHGCLQYAYVEIGYTMWCYFLSYYINHLNNISSSARLEAQWCVFSNVSLIENIAVALCARSSATPYCHSIKKRVERALTSVRSQNATQSLYYMPQLISKFYL